MNRKTRERWPPVRGTVRSDGAKIWSFELRKNYRIFFLQKNYLSMRNTDNTLFSAYNQ